MDLSVISDEFTSDPWTAFEIGRGWGFDNFDIRQAYRFRLPVAPRWAVDRTVAAVETHAVNVTGISPGIFKPVMNLDGSKVSAVRKILEIRGCFPTFDHGLSTNVGFEEHRRCMTRLHELCGSAHLDLGDFPRT